jgi:alpha-1,2-mannosyltransferase
MVRSAGTRSAAEPPPSARRARRLPPAHLASWVLAAGVAALAVSLGLWAWFISGHAGPDWSVPVDLQVYRDGGLIVTHTAPLYNGRLAAPLYGWPGYLDLKFTYSPFAALVFALLTVPALPTLVNVVIGVNLAALLATLWVTFTAVRDPASTPTKSPAGLAAPAGAAPAGAAPDPAADAPRAPAAGARKVLASRAGRLGMTLLAGAVLLWSEPVQRTLFLGQVELLLMAVVLADLAQSDRHWWKGTGVGVAAGIKLVPLIFIPYLLLTRRYRQAAVAAGTFVVTVGAGFLVLPGDSRRYWLERLFIDGSRTGFVGFGGNQSLRGILTRLLGSVAGAQHAWLAAAAVVAVLGLLAAAALDRAGERMLAVLTCALTGLLCSPISWDHHWVWIVPGVAVLAVYASRSRGLARWAYAGTAVIVAALFGAYPVTWWGEPAGQAAFTLGLIWAPPEANPRYNQVGDQPSFAVYHWHGLQLLTGNLYVLAGLVLLGLLVIRGGRGVLRRPQRPDTASTTSPTAAASST